MFIIKKILVLSMFVLLCQCGVSVAKDKQKKYINESYSKSGKSSYRYNYPNEEKELEVDLAEISGLAYNNLNNTLLAVNDEKGYVYELAIDDYEIISKNTFWNTGDYEGVGFDGKYVWVIKSNGKLYQFHPILKETEAFDTPLKMKNDAEGLCYDEDEQVLYIACKGSTLDKDDKSKDKAVYTFSTKKNKFKKKPVLKFHYKDILDFLDEVSKKKVDKNLTSRAKVFSPSAIQIQKTSSDLYILSARGSMLLVINLSGEIKELVFFNPKYLPQPEGLCFDDNGNLYISTEGKGKRAKIFVYKNAL